MRNFSSEEECDVTGQGGDVAARRPGVALTTVTIHSGRVFPRVFTIHTTPSVRLAAINDSTSFTTRLAKLADDHVHFKYINYERDPLDKQAFG